MVRIETYMDKEWKKINLVSQPSLLGQYFGNKLHMLPGGSNGNANRTGSLNIHHNDPLKLRPLLVVPGLHYPCLNKYLCNEWIFGPVNCLIVEFLFDCLFWIFTVLFLYFNNSPETWDVLYFLAMKTKIFYTTEKMWHFKKNNKYYKLSW